MSDNTLNPMKMDLSEHFTKFMCDNFKEMYNISTVEEAQALSDYELLKVRHVGKMFIQKLRNLKPQERPIDVYSYNKGVHDTVISICRLITDNYKKCITYRECEILLHEKNILK